MCHKLVEQYIAAIDRHLEGGMQGGPGYNYNLKYDLRQGEGHVVPFQVRGKLQGTHIWYHS